MRMRKIGAKLMVVATLGALGTVLPATAASASSWHNCPVDRVCAYLLRNGGGTVTVIPQVQPGNCARIGTGFLSVWNRTTFTQRVWVSTQCTGDSWPLYANQRIGDFVFRNYSIGDWP
jgi:hypothetical protein